MRALVGGLINSRIELEATSNGQTDAPTREILGLDLEHSENSESNIAETLIRLSRT